MTSEDLIIKMNNEECTHLHITLRLLTIKRIHFDLVTCASLPTYCTEQSSVCSADSLSAVISKISTLVL
jgi:hypothetical protein